MRAWAIGAVLGAVALAEAPAAHAYPVHRRYFHIAYERPTGCTLCHGHGGGTERNPYGRDWAERGETVAAFRAVDRLDSDGDGTSNGDEIRAGSHPGDAQSVPDRPGRSWTNEEAHLAIPTEQLDLVLEGYERIEASEVTLDDAQIREVERGARTRLRTEDRYPTLYFAVQEGRRTAVALFVDAPRGRDRSTMLVAAGLDGRIAGIALFRTPDEEGSLLLPYLRCLRGHGRQDVPRPGRSECPRVAGREPIQEALAAAVERALWTLSVVLASGGSGDGPPEPAVDAGTVRDAGTEPTAAASADPDGGGLDLDRVPTTDSVAVISPGAATAGALAAILVLLGLIAGSVRLALRLGADRLSASRLEALPGPSRLLAALLVVSLLLVQALAVVGVYVHTQIVHGSTGEYFQMLSWPRLIGTSHAHLFGYAAMYGLLAWLASLSSAREPIKCAIIAALLWGGIADVASWWAIKALSPRFEWLTLASGAITSTGSIVAAVLVLRSVLRRAPPPAPA